MAPSHPLVAAAFLAATSEHLIREFIRRKCEATPIKVVGGYLMHSQLLIRFLIAGALSCAASTQACAQAVPNYVLTKPERSATRDAAYKWEAGFLVLSAVDAAETIHCLDRNTCSEGNPIWGRHPSTAKIVLTKLGLGIVHFTVFKLIADDDPKTALRAAQVSAVVQGGFVMLNAHLAFR